MKSSVLSKEVIQFDFEVYELMHVAVADSFAENLSWTIRFHPIWNIDRIFSENEKATSNSSKVDCIARYEEKRFF